MGCPLVSSDGRCDGAAFAQGQSAAPTIQDAARNGDLGGVKALLDGNPDLVFSKDEKGITPLHAAAFAGRKEMAQFLLANKAEVNAKDISGETPLFVAVLAGNNYVAELLLANGADVNTADNKGHTPLAVAGGRRTLGSIGTVAPTRPGSTPRTTTAIRLYTRRLRDKRTWQRCCWPTGPMSTPGTRVATRLWALPNLATSLMWPSCCANTAAINRSINSYYATLARPFFSTSDGRLRDIPLLMTSPSPACKLCASPCQRSRRLISDRILSG